MGRGTTTKEVNVKKERSSISATARGNGNSSKEPKPGDSCLFSITGTVKLNNTLNIKTGDPAVLVPSTGSPKLLQLYINSTAGNYTGSFQKKVLECVQRRYVYEGEVTAIKKASTGISASYILHGTKR